jgi:ribonuclease T1
VGVVGGRVDRRSLIRGAALAVLAVLALYALLGGGGDDDSATSSSTTSATSAANTPSSPEGFTSEEVTGISEALAAIDSGDELPFEQDGGTFQNREGELPGRPHGYYREYTVITPGSDDRGARRLVIGSGGETFYTRDHYDSFVEIDPGEFR